MKLWVKIVIGMSVLLLFLFLMGVLTRGLFGPSIRVDFVAKGPSVEGERTVLVDATSENPLNILRAIYVNSGEIRVTGVSFFNRNEEVVDVKMDITSCKNRNEEVSKEKMPGVEKYTKSVSQEVQPNTPMVRSIKITENGLIPDTYICTLSAVDSNKPEIIYENKQFFLKVK